MTRLVTRPTTWGTPCASAGADAWAWWCPGRRDGQLTMSTIANGTPGGGPVQVPGSKKSADSSTRTPGTPQAPGGTARSAVTWGWDRNRDRTGNPSGNAIGTGTSPGPGARSIPAPSRSTPQASQPRCPTRRSRSLRPDRWSRVATPTLRTSGGWAATRGVVVGRGVPDRGRVPDRLRRG